MGKQRYHNLSEEHRAEVCRKNLLCQRVWKEKKVQEETFEEYRARLNARRREQTVEKKQAMGTEGWKRHQQAVYVKRAKSEQRKKWKEPEKRLARPFPLPWLPLEWAEHEDKEKDTVETIRANALESMDQYL